MLALVLIGPVMAPSAAQTPSTSGPDVVLLPTNHPRLPSDLALLWMAPERARGARSTALNQLGTAAKLEIDGDFEKALPLLTQLSKGTLRENPLGPYVEYYRGLAELRVGRAEEARRTFQALAATAPVGFLVEGAASLEAESDEALGDYSAAIAIYERLSNTKTTAPDDVLMRLGRAALAAGDAEKAMVAFSRLFFEFPLSDLSPLASAELDRLPNYPSMSAGSSRYKLELGRAERLFGSKRYSQARAAFDSVASVARGDDRELVNLRLAECDYFLKRPRATRDGVHPYIEKASRQGEALFFYAVAVGELGDRDEYLRVVRRLADDFPTQSWSEEALNNLASYYIVQDDDTKADETFREMFDKFPTGRYAERAAWKVGWLAYRNREYRDTVRFFETAAARFPRSDYRPPWLYWSGRAHAELKETSLAEERYALAATDYMNSYYGRLALKQLNGRIPPRRGGTDDELVVPAVPAVPVVTDALPPNRHIIRALLGLELFDDAIKELQYAQKVWGDSPAIQATISWVYNQRGELRPGINAMKRAYPQYMAAGGEKLPTDLLKVLFPIDYWPLIRRHATARNLDPYLIAALVAQESTFMVDARSPSNAYGLMQLLPSTGRRYAPKVGLGKRFSVRMLTTADANIRMGTAYFADLMKRFGGAYLALAGYNAGENRVARWISERGDIDRDEFIDDIPFPETQNYVKRILGTAEDYRRLYGSDAKTATD